MIQPPYSRIHITKRIGGDYLERIQAADLVRTLRLTRQRINSTYHQMLRIEEYLRATAND